MQHFLVFGTHPRLSLAEFTAIRPQLEPPILCGSAAIFDDSNWDAPVYMQKLGGTVKLGDVLGEMPAKLAEAGSLCNLVADRLTGTSINFGWTVFGGGKEIHQRLEKLAIPFKKELKNRGISSRWVTGEHGAALSPAAVAKLNLTTEGLDICLMVHGETLTVGLTTEVQNADAWSQRDYGRPARDEINGMLPPKLARMMVNLARTPEQGVIYDPFCGGGTILMEAALATQAKKITGSDVSEKMAHDTLANNAWLIRNHVLRPDDADRFQVFTSDVKLVSSHLADASVDAVVTEGYLGPPLRGYESQSALTKNASQITSLWENALTALHPILRAGGVIVGIWPAFKTDNGLSRVDLTESLQKLGFELVEPNELLIYQRPEQKIQRRIVILRKI